MHTTKLACLGLVLSGLAVTGCMPDYEYEGTYAMTYAAVVHTPNRETPEVVAGTTRVDVRKGLGDDYLLDLGSDFCQLVAIHDANQDQGEVQPIPTLSITPQACWMVDRERAMPMSLGGSASWDRDAEFLTIVLAGSLFDATGKPMGTTTVQFTESW